MINCKDILILFDTSISEFIDKPSCYYDVNTKDIVGFESNFAHNISSHSQSSNVLSLFEIQISAGNPRGYWMPRPANLTKPLDVPEAPEYIKLIIN